MWVEVTWFLAEPPVAPVPEALMVGVECQTSALLNFILASPSDQSVRFCSD